MERHNGDYIVYNDDHRINDSDKNDDNNDINACKCDDFNYRISITIMLIINGNKSLQLVVPHKIYE